MGLDFIPSQESGDLFLWLQADVWGFGWREKQAPPEDESTAVLERETRLLDFKLSAAGKWPKCRVEPKEDFPREPTTEESTEIKHKRTALKRVAARGFGGNSWHFAGVGGGVGSWHFKHFRWQEEPIRKVFHQILIILNFAVLHRGRSGGRPQVGRWSQLKRHTKTLI